MFLSRLIMSTRDRRARRDIANCAQLHRTVLRGFPALPPGMNFRQYYEVLYRLDPSVSPGSTVLLVQSNCHPDWAFLEEQTGYLQQPVECKPVAKNYEAIMKGQRLCFRLRANVTKKIDTKTRQGGRKSNGRRVALHRPEEQIAWLVGKARSCGFELLPLCQGQEASCHFDVRVTSEAEVTGREGVNERTLTFGSVLFEGLLRVTNRETFLRTLSSGIGCGKAYGFGLLSIARL
jgi:CRISPR system Cascade subunit CasE